MRTARTGHDVQLSGPSASYGFSKDLDDARRAFIVAWAADDFEAVKCGLGLY